VAALHDSTVFRVIGYMQKFTLTVAFAALLTSALAIYQSRATSAFAAPAHPKELDDRAWRAERAYPPLVFTSRAVLECSISSSQPGRQTMHTVSGQGFEFDMSMLPIKDGTVEVRSPGMRYKFNAFPSTRIPAEFKGIGKGTILQMKAEVEVDVKRFRQPAGPGTEIRFDAADINADAAYVEFTGLFVREADEKRFPFRVLFGSVTDGGGMVLPSGPNEVSFLLSKNVSIGSIVRPAGVTTAIYEAENDVAELK
jgi:hypothetical protein